MPFFDMQNFFRCACCMRHANRRFISEPVTGPPVCIWCSPVTGIEPLVMMTIDNDPGPVGMTDMMRIMQEMDAQGDLNQPSDRDVPVPCPECGDETTDARVRMGMKCTRCAYGG